MIDGELWIDATVGSIAEIDGFASESTAVFVGSTKMVRDYININGYVHGSPSRVARSLPADADDIGCCGLLRLLVIGDHILNVRPTYNPGRDLQCGPRGDAELGVVVATPEGRRSTRATTGGRLHDDSPGS